MTKKQLQYTATTGAFMVVNAIAFPGVAFGQAEQLQDGINSATPDNAQGGPNLFEDGGLFERITNTLLLLVGALSVIMLIVGGIRYVVSAGDQNAVQGAKNTILYAIVGIAVSFLAFAAVNFVVDQLNQ